MLYLPGIVAFILRRWGLTDDAASRLAATGFTALGLAPCSLSGQQSRTAATLKSPARHGAR